MLGLVILLMYHFLWLDFFRMEETLIEWVDDLVDVLDFVDEFDYSL